MFRTFALLMLLASGISVPAVNKRDRPIVIEHGAGETVQAVFGTVVNGAMVWQTLSDDHFSRGESQTIMVAPPGDYVVTTGDSQIIKVVEDGQPKPKPNPGPSPDPSPDPEPVPPTPTPIVDGLVWVMVFEQTSDRSKLPDFAELMASGYLADLDANADFEFQGYDVDSDGARKRRAWWQGKELPVAVLTSESGEVLAAEHIESESDLRSVIKEATGRE